ncbi:hypothetical protein PA598K_04384 [Paenibacillus sp. 598K]|uniref:polysaccharide pyruvyl transferase family protein n=1 Tax=Paenibacillus sp. 598K TaxID=1117987 RepID=UPI000FF9C8D9|nr:polysaccharide pyruvyl transferase family protein [Paenibacillus sp. 598K]GBF75948.1 hypothetical protein PA598K_04384 [Paenibacillus sp. 598K]
MKSILYIGWVGFNNLGDELMFDIFKRYVSESKQDFKLTPVNNEAHELWYTSMTDYDYVVLGGGSLIGDPVHPFAPYLFECLAAAIQANRKVIIWGSGMDWLPRSVLSSLLANETEPLHLPDPVLAHVREVFTQSYWCGVRGPLTQSLLASIGIPGIRISGDPAFLMPPPQTEQDATSDRLVQPIIGVNWGTAHNRIYGSDEAHVEEALVEVLRDLQAQGYTLYFYTMWELDLEHAQRLHDKLADSGKTVFDPHIHHQDTFVNLLSQFEYTINFKLHASYISLAARVPFIALGYRFKVYDFAHSVDMAHYVVDMDALDLKEQLLQKASVIPSIRAALVETMTSAQQRYAERIAEPFRLKLFN